MKGSSPQPDPDPDPQTLITDYEGTVSFKINKVPYVNGVRNGTYFMTESIDIDLLPGRRYVITVNGTNVGKDTVGKNRTIILAEKRSSDIYYGTVLTNLSDNQDEYIANASIESSFRNNVFYLGIKAGNPVLTATVKLQHY